MKKIIIIILLACVVSLHAQQRVNVNLFGYTAETTFIFYDMNDTTFMNKVLEISPQVLRFPGSNFYHFGRAGYGLDLEEIDEWHKAGFPKRARGLLRNTQRRGHKHDYIHDFIVLAKKTKSKVIITANIITAEKDEIIQIIKKIKSEGVKIAGIEMGGELSNESYKHKIDKDKYIELAKNCSDNIKQHYPKMKTYVVAAPLMQNKSHRHSLWNKDLAKESFYDGIIVHNYVMVTYGKDRFGRMVLEIPEGDTPSEAFDTYKKRALDFFSSGFPDLIKKYNMIFDSKDIWITEWNLQYSNITGNTLLQGLFSANYFLELSSDSALNKVRLTTFHNLGGRDYGGSIFAYRNNKSEIQSTFYPLKMLSAILTDSTLIISKEKISDEITKYIAENSNKHIKYICYINWSSALSEVIINKKPKKEILIEEYYGNDLFSKMDNEEEIFYKKNKVRIKNKYKTQPYSLTIIKLID